MSFDQEYQAFCAAHGTPDRVELLLVDLNGIFRGKSLPAGSVPKIGAGGVRLPLSTYAPAVMGENIEASGLGAVSGDPDGVLVPVPGSLKPAPWLPGHVAQALVEMTDEGAPVAYSPRQILGQMLDRFSDHGWTPVVASELEFYLIQARARVDEAPVPPAACPETQNYEMEVISAHADLLKAIEADCAAQGLATDTLTAEYGPGQFEINFHHTSDVQAAAETALMFRRLVRGVAEAHGFEATFMAKPYADRVGSGMHLHASVLDTDGENIFAAAGGVDLAPRLAHAVGGVVSTMRDLQAIFAPHGNSYRRFRPGGFAPSTPDWGYDNRLAAIRLPATQGPAARLEHRICGADVNPYLAITGILGGMLHGLENEVTPPAPIEDGKPIGAALAQDWSVALDRFEASSLASEMFGDYVRLYTVIKRAEIEAIQAPISPIEYRHYLSHF